MPTRHHDRPGCWIDGEATPRASWAIDQGRACMNASSPALWADLLRHTPGCQGCSRAKRAHEAYWHDSGLSLDLGAER